MIRAEQLISAGLVVESPIVNNLIDVAIKHANDLHFVDGLVDAKKIECTVAFFNGSRYYHPVSAMTRGQE